MNAILVTGASGLVGGEVVARMLAADPGLHVWALARDPRRLTARAAELGAPLPRITPLHGDLTLPRLGLAPAARRRVAAEVRAVVHAAADIGFARPLPLARAVNTEGTARVLELARECPGLERFLHISTAYVAGRRTGGIPEGALGDEHGWVNGYEQSKYEGETLVRGSGLPWAVLRSGCIVCDDATGRISQRNAAHAALNLLRAGLVPMLPGREENPLDLVTTSYVAGAVARLARDDSALGRTFHLCAGAGAIPLGDLLDRCFAFWRRDPEWRRRSVARPALAELDTYREFELAVEETADPRLRSIVRSLSSFAPQLALPKRFQTDAADAALGRPAPAVASFLEPLLRQLEAEAVPREGWRAA